MAHNCMLCRLGSRLETSILKRGSHDFSTHCQARKRVVKLRLKSVAIGTGYSEVSGPTGSR